MRCLNSHDCWINHQLVAPNDWHWSSCPTPHYGVMILWIWWINVVDPKIHIQPWIAGVPFLVKLGWWWKKLALPHYLISNTINPPWCLTSYIHTYIHTYRQTDRHTYIHTWWILPETTLRGIFCYAPRKHRACWQAWRKPLPKVWGSDGPKSAFIFFL